MFLNNFRRRLVKSSQAAAEFRNKSPEFNW